MSASSAPPASSRHGLALGPLMAGPVIYVFAQSLVIPSISSIARDLHITELDATWGLTSYLISGAVLTPIAGRLGDMFGKRRVLLWVLWLTAAGLLINALWSGLPGLLVGRLLGGVSLATMPLAYGIIRETAPPRRVAPDIALLSASIAIGTGVGQAVAGLVVDHLGTAWLFWLPFIVTVPTLVTAWRWVPESTSRKGGEIDWLGAAVMAGGLLSLLIAISESTIWGWGSWRTIGLVAVGIVALVIWVRVELATRAPLIDVRLLGVPAVWWPNLTAALFGFGMFGAFTLVPAFVELPRATGIGFGFSITAAGLLVVPATITMGLGGPLSGRLVHRFGAKQPLIAGGVLGGAGFAMLGLVHSSAGPMYAGFALLGLGMGVGYAILPHMIVLAVPQEHTAAATAMNTIARNLGGALGVQVCATVVAATVGAGAPFGTGPGYDDAFWVFAAAGLAATLCAFCIPYRRTATLAAVTAA
jgi:MFS family permease